MTNNSLFLTNTQDAEAKKEDAVASYEAWKEKKMENLKAKAKEKQDMARKEQQASEEKTERRQSAKQACHSYIDLSLLLSLFLCDGHKWSFVIYKPLQMFEKWKKETDHVLKEKHQKQKDAENKLRLKKQRKEEERRRECVSAFTHW